MRQWRTIRRCSDLSKLGASGQWQARRAAGIYYVQDRLGRIWLMTVYAKSARENIAVKTLLKLKESIDHAQID